MSRLTDRRSVARRRGFTLGHVLIALPLLAVFTFVSTQLLLATWRASWDTRVSAESAARLDAALHRLRADAWGAAGISVAGASATLRQPDGATVVWQSGPPAGRLVRTVTGGEAPTRCDGLPPGIAFASHDTALRVSVPNPAAGRTDELTLPSQVLVAGRGQ